MAHNCGLTPFDIYASPLTCDDRILSRYKSVINAINPIQFTIEGH